MLSNPEYQLYSGSREIQFRLIDGFSAPKDQQIEWNREGWKERVVLSFGVIVRSP